MPATAPASAIARLLHYQQRPDIWAKRVLGANLYDYQEQILQAVVDHDSVAVHTGHGVGKTATAAIKLLHHLFCYPDPKVISTAPTWRQVKDTLWSEVHHWLGRLDRDEALWDGPIGTAATRITLAPDVFATGESATDPAKLEGYHARNILYIVDEAKAVPDPVFDSIEGALTSGINIAGSSKRLYISTPGQPAGRFYDICSGKRPGWVVIHVSGERSPQVSRQWVNERRIEWGEDSFRFRTRVLGLFDDRAFDSIIPYSDLVWCGENPNRPQGKLQIGVDVARSGGDRTVIALRQGDCLLSVVIRHKRDTVWTAETVRDMTNAVSDKLRVGRREIRIVVDDVGVGGGVTDQLRKWKYNVFGFVANGVPKDETKYRTRRDEVWFEFAKKVKDGEFDYSRIAPRELRTEIAGELSSVAYNFKAFKGNEVFVAEPKSETKKRLGQNRSPDLADAIILAFANPVRTFGSGLIVLRGARRREQELEADFHDRRYNGTLDLLKRR